MPNAAIIVGNANYSSQNLNNLQCCADDVEAIKSLIESTGKYDIITHLIDVNADDIKEAIRQIISRNDSINEIFFYFSGHGIQKKSEFYCCGTGFDSLRPNETGLSTTELHSLIRAANPNLVVKVIDACHSGTSLIKAEEAFGKIAKGDLGNFIQIASCLDSQFSLTGEPLSQFTQSFCEATLRKSEGAIFYTDIINSLRDIYLGDDFQTPHFVSQGTGREIFAEDANLLAGFRTRFKQNWQEIQEEASADYGSNHPIEHRAAMLRLIEKAETQFATPDLAKDFIDTLFDNLISLANSSEFTDFFDVIIEEHSQYRENSVERFIVKCLSGERRPDNFVTAYKGRKRIKNSAWPSSLSYLYGDEFSEIINLELNCSLPRIQIKIIFRPKFRSIDQISLIITCAPSINSCYIFENSMIHLRRDWESFEENGFNIVEKWYNRPWSEDITWLSRESCDRLFEYVEKHIDQATKRISDNSTGES